MKPESLAFLQSSLLYPPVIPFRFKAKWFAIGAAVMMIVGRVL